MIKYFCDCCGLEILEDSNRVSYTTYDSRALPAFHLHKDCVSKLVKFFNKSALSPGVNEEIVKSVPTKPTMEEDSLPKDEVPPTEDSVKETRIVECKETEKEEEAVPKSDLAEGVIIDGIEENEENSPYDDLDYIAAKNALGEAPYENEKSLVKIDLGSLGSENVFTYYPKSKSSGDDIFNLQRIMIAHYIGWTYKMIESKLGCKYVTAYQRVNKYKKKSLELLYKSKDSFIVADGRKLPWRTICNLFLNGWNYTKISQEYHVSKDTVEKIIIKFSGMFGG